MKLQVITELNKLGLNTVTKKFKYAVDTLKGGTLPNPSQTVIKPAVPATAAIIGTGTSAAPQFPAVPAKKAVMSPLVKPIPDWIGSITTGVMVEPTIERVTLYLPYSPAAIALGAVLDVKQIQEITVKGFDLGLYQGDLTGVTPTSDTAMLVGGLPATLEQYCYAQALLMTAPVGYVNIIEPSIYKPNPNHPGIPVIKIDAYLFNDSGVGYGN